MLKKLATLAGAVGVGSTASDTWQATRSGVAWLLGHGQPAEPEGSTAQGDGSDGALVATASTPSGRTDPGRVRQDRGQFVPAWRVCAGLLVIGLVPRLVGLT